MINKTLTHLMCSVGLAVAGGFIASQGAFAHDDMKKGDGTMMMHDDMMAKMDTNHDGMVSAAEHAAYAKQMFDNADINHDGMLSKDEVEAAHRKMRAEHEAMEHHDDDAMRHDDDDDKAPIKK